MTGTADTKTMEDGDVTRRFKTLLEQTLIPDFCSKSARNMKPSGFNANLTRLSELDMADFLRGWDAQLLRHIGNGLYRAPQSGASEQFFWSGRKANVPRTFTISTESIIALSVLARMHLDFGWPKELIGTQSKRTWAFDVSGYKSESDLSPLMVCEVKKSSKEIDALIDYMQSLGRQPSLSGAYLKSAEKNAFMKVKALRAQTPSIFWAVGPNRYERVFWVHYSEGDVIEFDPITLKALMRKRDF
jgi:hypothetical protein